MYCPCNKTDILSTKVNECFYNSYLYVYKCIPLVTSQIFFSTNYINGYVLIANVYRSKIPSIIQRIITLSLYKR